LLISNNVIFTLLFVLENSLLVESQAWCLKFIGFFLLEMKRNQQSKTEDTQHEVFAYVEHFLLESKQSQLARTASEARSQAQLEIVPEPESS